MQKIVNLVMSHPRALVTRGSLPEKQAVVAVLGWAGGSDKNVSKYSELYQNQGYTTVQFTAAPLSVGWGVKNTRDVTNLAESLKNEVKDEKSRLIFHCFSMNGFLSICALDLQFPELRVFERCDGLFLDSCPIRFDKFSWNNIKQYALVIDHVYAAMNPSKNFVTNFFYNILKLILITQFTMSATIENTMTNTGLVRRQNISSWHYALYHPALPSVVSLVYSDADPVCSSRDICDWHMAVDKRDDSGKREIIVTRHVDSPHVEHFRKYPQEYRKQVDEFIKRIEKIWERKNASKI